MQSRIDWNEIVPRLDAGLRQTLYLEAVKLISEGRAKRMEYNRNYQREYQRQRYDRNKPRIGAPRKWTDARIARVREYYKAHGWTATIQHFKISSSMLTKWGITKKTV